MVRNPFSFDFPVVQPAGFRWALAPHQAWNGLKPAPTVFLFRLNNRQNRENRQIWKRLTQTDNFDITGEKNHSTGGLSTIYAMKSVFSLSQRIRGNPDAAVASVGVVRGRQTRDAPPRAMISRSRVVASWNPSFVLGVNLGGAAPSPEPPLDSANARPITRGEADVFRHREQVLKIRRRHVADRLDHEERAARTKAFVYLAQ